MSTVRNSPPANAFFLDAEGGERFCLFHPPSSSGKAIGNVIYVHPFCEEMNCSRRMAALQARSLAALGYGVFQMDLFGCGDSSGDFGDARWSIWKSDLALARRWIDDHNAGPVALWGLRLGALLALDYVREAEQPVSRIALWHPVTNGDAHLSQFWRMKLAGQMLSGEGNPDETKSIRESVAQGRHVEVAGYTLAAELVRSIEHLRLAQLAPNGVSVDWFDLAPRAGSTLAPAIAKTADAWSAAGVDLHLHLLGGHAFWSSPEVGISQPLLDATTRQFAEVPN
jgi:exosortase A-associated hydrolase 2